MEWHWGLRQLAAACVMWPFPTSTQTISSWELKLMGHGGDEKTWFNPCIILMYLNYDKTSLDTNVTSTIWEHIKIFRDENQEKCITHIVQKIVSWWLLIHECCNHAFYKRWMLTKLNNWQSGGHHFKSSVTSTKHHSLCAENFIILMIADIWMLWSCNFCMMNAYKT